MAQPKRVLLKLSGEALGRTAEQGICQDQLGAMASAIVNAAAQNVQVGVVVGGGNFLRGGTIANDMISRNTADQMGMMATVMNGLALRDAIIASGGKAQVYSAKAIDGIAHVFEANTVISELEKGVVAIFVAGTGNPFVTTDSAASLRAIEIQADILLKATKVDGIYAEDPNKNPHAERFAQLTFDEALDKRLAIMDIAAFSQCRDYQLPIRVFNLFKENALENALLNQAEGTMVKGASA